MDLGVIQDRINYVIKTLADKEFYSLFFEDLKRWISVVIELFTPVDPLGSFMAFTYEFSFFYPLVMTYVWMLGAIIYYFRWERKQGNSGPILKNYPPVSILIPCYNESACIEETISYLENIDYPNYEIIAVNDKSTDNTLELLIKLSEKYPKLRVVNLEKNQGKAAGLYVASLASENEFLICIDADALLDKNAITWMMQHFLDGPRVGAVTGNPRIRTRSTLLGRIQVCEFSAIIGLIKRAQRAYGRLFTVSGVIVGFRKSVLHRVGYWSHDMITEDIDISWKLQLDHWQIRYEPHALCWILMPETLKGLFSQRLRWAQGGAEVLLRYGGRLKNWDARRMLPVYIEYLISVAWAYAILLNITLWAVGTVFTLPEQLTVPTIAPNWGGVLLGITCLFQFGVSLLIDSNYEKNIFKYYFWVIWYPIAYWMLNAVVSTLGLPKAIFKKKGEKAVWTSPDRGVEI